MAMVCYGMVGVRALRARRWQSIHNKILKIRQVERQFTHWAVRCEMRRQTMAKAMQIKREYIEAAYGLLCEKEFDEITIRQLAKETGRNSASLYYYFNDLRSLLSIASVRYLMDYYDTVSTVASSYYKAFEINLQSWGCLAWYAFHNVPIYENFFLYDSSMSEKALNEYLEAFPEEKDIITKYFFGESFYSLDLRMRDKWILRKSVEEGMIAEKSVEYLGELDYYLFCGMMGEIRHTYKDEEVFNRSFKKFIYILTETYRRQLLPGCSMLGCHLETLTNP